MAHTTENLYSRLVKLFAPDSPVAEYIVAYRDVDALFVTGPMQAFAIEQMVNKLLDDDRGLSPGGLKPEVWLLITKDHENTDTPHELALDFTFSYTGERAAESLNVGIKLTTVAAVLFVAIYDVVEDDEVILATRTDPEIIGTFLADVGLEALLDA